MNAIPGMIRSIKNTSAQIFSETVRYWNGTKQLLYHDRLRYRKIRRKIKDEKLLPHQLSISDALHLYTHSKNMAKFRVATLPALTLFCVPVVGYLAIPAFLFFPKIFLVNPMMTSEQQKMVTEKRHQMRRSNYKLALLSMGETLSDAGRLEDIEQLKRICSSASKKLDPCDLIVESLPVFSSGALSISSLSRDALLDIAACCEVPQHKMLPSFILKYAIERRAKGYKLLTDTLQENLTDTSALSTMGQHEMKALAFELLHEQPKDDENLEVAVSRLRQFSVLLKEQKQQYSKDAETSVFLHGLIYLATKQNK
ncbi:uncharacterized protein LOC142337554 [Convolutriloba macropyga]|uniref:uncharacterized protein LOC142337554 n=1 Tax=Convolutriloba macropyga TaxID=536237 RepID=UPI003F51CBD4